MVRLDPLPFLGPLGGPESRKEAAYMLMGLGKDHFLHALGPDQLSAGRCMMPAIG